MRPSWGVIGWLPLVWLTACVASHTAERTAGSERPAVDRLLTRGDIQVAQRHLRAFGFDPGPIDGIYTAQTQPPYGLSRPPMVSWCQDGSIARRARCSRLGWTPSRGISHRW
jgi:hypothetical protein